MYLTWLAPLQMGQMHGSVSIDVCLLRYLMSHESQLHSSATEFHLRHKENTHKPRVCFSDTRWAEMPVILPQNLIKLSVVTQRTHVTSFGRSKKRVCFTCAIRFGNEQVYEEAFRRLRLQFRHFYKILHEIQRKNK